MGDLIWLVTFLILVSSSAAAVCDRCVHTSYATYAYMHFDKGGTCQYGADQTEFNGNHPAGAVRSIYRAGEGCGAYYQVRCTVHTKKINCSAKGIEIIVTSTAPENKGTDIVLSREAFNGLFVGKTDLTNVGIQYKRIKSVYGERQPMKIRVESLGKNGGKSLLKLLYQGGQTYVKKMAMVFKGSAHWYPMKRINEGAIWEVPVAIPINSSVGFNYTAIVGLNEQQFLSGFLQIKELRGVYGLRNQLDNKIAQEKCDVCDHTTWR